MPNIIAIDFSISSPALTIVDEENNITFICVDEKNVGLKKQLDDKHCIIVLDKVEHRNDIIRFDILQRRLIKALKDNIKKSTVCLEGYSFGASGQLTRIAEACGILKHNLYKEGAEKVMPNYAPSSIKKFATGSGRASKHDMVDAFKEKTNIDLFKILSKKEGLKSIPAPITDIVDSYWIAQFHISNLSDS